MTDKMIVACPECRTRFVAPLEKFLPNGRKVRCAKCSHAWFQRVGEEPQPLAEPKPAAAMPAPVKTPPPPAAATAGSALPPEPAKPPLAVVDKPPAAEISESDVTESKPETPKEEIAAKPEKPTRSTIAESVERTEAVRSATAAAAGAGAAATMTAASYASNSLAPARSERRMPAGATAPIPEPKRKSGFWRILFYSLAALIMAGALAYFFRQPLAQRFPGMADPLNRFAAQVDGVVGKVVPAATALRIENVKYDFTDDGGRAMLLTADVVNDGAGETSAPRLLMKIVGTDGKVLHEATIPPEDMSDTISPEGRNAYFIRIPSPPETIERVEVDFAPQG